MSEGQEMNRLMELPRSPTGVLFTWGKKEGRRIAWSHCYLRTHAVSKTRCTSHKGNKL